MFKGSGPLILLRNSSTDMILNYYWLYNTNVFNSLTGTADHLPVKAAVVIGAAISSSTTQTVTHNANTFAIVTSTFFLQHYKYTQKDFF